MVQIRMCRHLLYLESIMAQTGMSEGRTGMSEGRTGMCEIRDGMFSGLAVRPYF